MNVSGNTMQQGFNGPTGFSGLEVWLDKVNPSEAPHRVTSFNDVSYICSKKLGELYKVSSMQDAEMAVTKAFGKVESDTPSDDTPSPQPSAGDDSSNPIDD